VPASLKAQASRRPDTFADVIAESGATLVLPMSPFGYGHDPVGTAAPAKAVLTGAGPPLLHPVASTVITTSNVAGANSLTPGRARLVSSVLILTPPPYIDIIMIDV
jgi:hypothetical protein